MHIFKIAKSYIKNKNQNGMSKFHSWLAIIGITLGVTALIVVSSVMNGIFTKIYDDLNAEYNYDISVYAFDDSDIYNIYNIIGQDNIISKIKAKVLKPPYIAKVEKKHALLYIVDNNVEMKEQGIYLNESIKIDKKALFLQIYKSGYGFLDQDLLPINHFSEEYSKKNIGLNSLFISKKDFDESFFVDVETENMVYFKIKNFMDAQEINRKLNKHFEDNNDIVISGWYSSRPQLVENLTLEYTIIKIVLFFIILVSSFSVMSTITLIISEKKQDIFVLKTIGYSNKNVVSVFLISGLFIGIVGIILGIILGLLISYNLKEIISFIEVLLRVDMLPDSLDSFPVIINYVDFFGISILTLVLVFFSSLIPSMKTVNISPAEGLKSE